MRACGGQRTISPYLRRGLFTVGCRERDASWSVSFGGILWTPASHLTTGVLRLEMNHAHLYMGAGGAD